MNNSKTAKNKSKGPRKANGGAMRQATFSNSKPSTVKTQRSAGFQRKASAPVATSTQQRVRAPQVTRTPKGMRIVHRELVGTVLGSIAFSATKFAVNPGIAATFPWLAPQAVQWEQYRFNKCNFEYVTRTSTSTVGSVILAPDYDASDLAPTTEAQITAYQDAVEDVAWKDITCSLDRDSMHPLGPRKFIRSVATGGDVKTYDVANLFLGVVEETGAGAIGKLWVDYDVELYVPQNSPSAASGPDATSTFNHFASQTFTTATPAELVFEQVNFDPLGIGAQVAGVFTPPAGTYLIQVSQTFADSSAEQFKASWQTRKNGAFPLPGVVATTSGLMAAAGSLNLSSAVVLTFNGTDTFDVLTTLTGAVGTLTGTAFGGTIIFSLA